MKMLQISPIINDLMTIDNVDGDRWIDTQMVNVRKIFRNIIEKVAIQSELGYIVQIKN